MSNTTDISTINLINNLSSQINRYITLFVFLFGIIGNFLSILVLSQSTLRKNPCVLYFLGSSVSSLGIILMGLPTRLIAGWISTDPSNTNRLLCKFRIFFLYGFRTTSVWLIVLATIDRWFLSSAKITRRRLSSRQIAYKGIITIHILSFSLWAESIYCYDAEPFITPVKCYGKSAPCRTFNDTVYASSTVIIPSILMLIFGFSTIHNINRTRRAIEPFIATIMHIDPITRKKRKKLRRNEGSLTRMLLLQIIVLTLFSLPQALQQFYLTFTIEVIKDPLRIAIENFIINFNFSLTYVGNASHFYIYTLTGTMFRQTLIRLIRSTIRQLKIYLLNLFLDFINFIFTIARQRVAPVR